ncbi:Endonuclease/exonuclease/phosphatase, partial [Amanita muscaria]
RACLKIASLNMRGGNPNTSLHKWECISHMSLQAKRVGILALQETHLSDEGLDNLRSRFNSRFHIVHSKLPDRHDACGVAFVLDKKQIAWKEMKTTNIIPGRAILLTTSAKQYDGKPLHILNVYAPNDHSANRDFWNDIKKLWEDRRLPRPHIILGDFNIVEFSVDRLPPHPDPENSVEALHDLMTMFKLTDGWRHTFPDTLAFTYRRDNHTTQSHIDRAYVSDFTLKDSRCWTIDYPSFNTDHKMLSFELFDPTMPFIGKGRWVIPLFLLKRRGLLNKIKTLGTLALRNMSRCEAENRSPVHNPQTVYSDFKRDLTSLIRDYAKSAVPHLEKQIRQAQIELDSLLKNETTLEEERLLRAGILDEKIASMERDRVASARTSSQARNMLEGETIGKYWMNLNKSKAPRDTLKSLRIPCSEPPGFVTRSDKMTEIARNYYDSLQSVADPIISDDRTELIDKVLESIDTVLPPSVASELSEQISEAEIYHAIKDLPTGKAAGLDGIPHELWRILVDEYNSDRKNEKPSFSICSMLQLVFNDIECNGIDDNSDFAEGWLCPLYKKKDRTDISNYRPITVLNTDYKILTKLITIRL